MTTHHNQPRFLWPTLLLFVFLLGWSQRFYIQSPVLPTISAYEQGQQATLTNLDGYFYLRAAKDLMDDNYTSVDTLRNAPEGLKRREPAPLLARTMAGASQASGLPLAWIAAVTPALFAVFIAVPIFLMGRMISSPATGIGAAVLTILSPFYSLRTSVNWLDTDCLVVTLILGITASLMSATHHTGPSRWSRFVLTILLAYLLFEWWDQAPGPVFLFVLFQYCAAILIESRQRPQEALALFGLTSLFVVVSIGPARLYGFIEQAIHQGLYVFQGHGQEDWPAIAGFVAEQTSISLSEGATMAIGGTALALVGAVGLIVLLANARRLALLMVAPLCLGLLALIAQRFTLFLAPWLALGIAHLAYRIWTSGNPQLSRLRIAGPLLFLVAALSQLPPTAGVTVDPLFPTNTMKAARRAAESTPNNAVIWSDWDYGYPIQYHAKRMTIADGGLHEGQRSVFLYRPLASDSPALAAHFMSLVAAHGVSGIKSTSPLSSHDHEPTLDDSTPNYSVESSPPGPGLDARPVYLLLDIKTAEAFNVSYRAGSWDKETRSGATANSKLFRNIFPTAALELRGPGISIDLSGGNIHWRGDTFPLKTATWSASNRSRHFSYPHQHGLVLEYREDEKIAMIMPESITWTVFFQLYFRNNGGGWFDKIDGDGINYQLWRVISDP